MENLGKWLVWLKLFCRDAKLRALGEVEIARGMMRGFGGGIGPRAGAPRRRNLGLRFSAVVS